jgi:hypothetical protein
MTTTFNNRLYKGEKGNDAQNAPHYAPAAHSGALVVSASA